MLSNRSIQALAALGAVAATVPASPSRASLEIYNVTSETVFMMWVTPAPSCRSQWRFGFSLVAPGEFVRPYEGNARNVTFYYSAWSQFGSNGWFGEYEFWLPTIDPRLDFDNEGAACMPAESCKASSRRPYDCKAGDTYMMFKLVSPSVDHRVNIAP